MPQSILNQSIEDRIIQLSELHDIDSDILEEFARFVVKNHSKKDKKSKSSTKKAKPLTLSQLKKTIYKYFDVKDTTELRQSGSFKMATDGMDDLNLRLKETWEMLYRKFVGILPNEQNQQGYGCINGINVFDYFKPWQVFGLDGKTATSEDIKKAYRDLSKKYHPDVPKTGDAHIFDRINTMYKSISAEA